MKTSALYKLYEESEFWKQGMNAHNFHSHLRELGFTEANKFKKIKDGYDIYDITYDQLLEFGKKRKWFDKSDIEIQQELKEADIEDDDKIYVDKRKYLETDERLRKMESRIKLLSEFVEIQSAFNHQQKIRNKQMTEFNKIINNYGNIKTPQKKLVKVEEQKTVKDNQDNKKEKLSYDDFDDLNEFVKK
jgi:4-alpha-glucanotransferase